MTAPAVTNHAAHAGHADPVANRLGMWIFLTTEVLLFGVLFVAYAWFHVRYRLDYHESARHLDRAVGALNTVVLLTSSLTVALAVRAFQRGLPRMTARWLLATVALALVFLGVKAFEWSHKFAAGLSLDSAFLNEQSQGVIVFFGLYYVMTGLHALHVAAGALVLGVTALRVARRPPPRASALVENVGLYWHLVDLVWIYLFPLFYLVAR